MNKFILLFAFTACCLTGFSQTDSLKLKPDSLPFIDLAEMPSWIGCEDLKGDELQNCNYDKLAIYLKKNFKYPFEARKKNMAGRVYVQFTINEKGEVTDPKVVKGVSDILDTEAVKMVSNMPNWNPGKLRGFPVKVLQTLPINFVLD